MLRRLLIGCAFLAVISGCGTNPPHPAATSSSPHPAGTKTASPGQQAQADASRGSASPRQRAQADAASILASFVPLPGARKLSAAPSVDGGLLGHPQLTAASSDFVDDASWWQVPGQFATEVLTWETAHVSPRFTFTGSGGDDFGSDFWSLPPVAGVLDSRWLVVTAVNNGAGGTDLRVESQVAYTPARPAASYIPGTAVHAVEVTAVALNDPRKPPAAPIVVTNPVRVKKLVALVNGLPLVPPGVYHCPEGGGGAVRLTFLSSAGRDKVANGPAIRSAVVAVALATTSGCGGVQLTIAGTQTSLGGGPSAAQQALAISGLRWTLYTYPG
jgi:hypothetical protein